MTKDSYLSASSDLKDNLFKTLHKALEFEESFTSAANYVVFINSRSNLKFWGSHKVDCY